MIRVDWSLLPDDLLRRIIEKYITTMEDYARFSCVCRSWYSIASGFDKSELRDKWSRQMPLLMLTDGNDREIYFNLAKGTRSSFFCTSVSMYDLSRFNVNKYVKDYNMERDHYFHSDDEDEDYNDNERNMIRCLLRVKRGTDSKCFNVSLPEAYGKACWGSRYGWIVTLGHDRQMGLVNPITRATLPLPPQSSFPLTWKIASGKTIRLEFMDRAILIRVPRDEIRHGNISRDSPCCAYCDDGIWLVVALYHENKVAAIAKPGDSSWMPILWGPRRSKSNPRLLDVVYCTRLSSLVFVDSRTNMYICDLHDIEHPQPLRKYFKDLEPSVTTHHKYLVESCCDEILIISRYTLLRENVDFWGDAYGFKFEVYGEFESHLTLQFRVYKFDIVTMRCEELYDLGNAALFIGNNATIFVSGIDAEYEANSIYYCDDSRISYHMTRNRVGGHDMGIFKMADKMIRPFYDGHRSKSSYCCPVWFCPSI